MSLIKTYPTREYEYPRMLVGEPVKVAAVQIEPRLSEENGTLKKFSSYLESAAREGASLVVFPELSLTGLMKATAETVPSPSTEALAVKAKEYGVYVVAGMLEKHKEKFYNTAILIGPSGFIGKYRKIHPWYPSESQIPVQPGDLRYTVFSTGIGKIGIMICYDAWFPEPARVLALGGADIIAFPTLTGLHSCFDYILRTRALENHVWRTCSCTRESINPAGELLMYFIDSRRVQVHQQFTIEEGMKVKDEELADIVLLNGKIVTVDANDRIAEAVAVKNGKIVSAGSNHEIEALIGEETKVIDLKGKTLLPGFIDSHTHLADAVLSLKFFVDARTPPNKSVSEILKRIKERTRETPPGQWIIAQGSMFQECKLTERRYANKDELDEAAPDNPVVMLASAHVSIVNSKALEVAGITKDTPDPSGGRIERDKDTGEPTGVLRECYKLLPIPYYTHDQIKEAVKIGAQKWWIQQGITTVHCFSGSYAMRVYQELLEEGELPLRIHWVVYTEDPKVGLDSLINLGIRMGFGNDWIKISGLKIFVDGAFIGLSAATYEPYVGMPDYCGLLKLTSSELTEIVVKAHREGIRLCIHAIGDKAQDIALDAIEEALRVLPKKDHRHRIEHLGNELTSKERIRRAKRLGVIPVPTVEWIYAYGDFIETYLGPERAKQSFLIRSLLDEGLMPPSSSDTLGTEPLSINPFFSIWCAVTRKTFSGNVLIPEESISVMDAIRMYTINGAYAGFEENIKGSIEPGKLADMIVISDDILTIPADKIKDIRVEMTIIDGKMVYQR